MQVAEEVSKNLASLKEVLSGTGDKEPQTEAVAQLAQELYNTNLLIALIANLQRIDFEVGGGRCTYFCNGFMCAKSIDRVVQTPNGEWECVCLIWTSVPKAKMSLHIISSQLAIRLSGFFFSLQGKKDVVHLFSNIVRRQIGTRTPTVEYISTHPQILFMLLKG